MKDLNHTLCHKINSLLSSFLSKLSSTIGWKKINLIFLCGKISALFHFSVGYTNYYN